jgi:MerR family mercuric resistance operon transcriptional regulator
MRISRGFTIGKLAKASGVNLETIRYYERIGLMPEPGRTEAGHRQYEDHHRRRLVFVRRGRELGFSLEEIRALLDLAEPQRRSCDEVQKIAGNHLVSVRAKIGDLARLEALLTATVDRCAAHAEAPACPVLNLLESDGPPILS